MKKIISLILSITILAGVFSQTAFYAFAEENKTAYIDVLGGYSSYASGSRASTASLDNFEKKYSAPLSAILKGLNAFSAEINIERYGLNLSETEDIILYLTTYKQVYFIGSSIPCSHRLNGTIISIRPDYTMSKSTVAAGNKLINEKMNALAAEASRLSTDIEKILYAHDYVLGNLQYDFKGFQNRDQTHNNIYYALKDGLTMCVGYAETFNLALTRMGIKSYIVTSELNSHAWNMVYIDGNFYYVDCTFDDPYYSNPNLLNNPLSDNYGYENLMCSASLLESNGHRGNDWEVNGFRIRNYASSDLYDKFFWHNVDERIVYGDKYWCAVYAKNSKTPETAGFTISEIEFLSNSKYSIKTVRDISSCYTMSDGHKEKLYFSQLQPCVNEIYYRTDKGIYLYNRNSDSDTLVFSPERTDNVFDFVIDEDSYTFSVMYGDKYSEKGEVVKYNLNDYFCTVLNHLYVWKTKNSYQVNCCGRCGLENFRLKFTDLKGYEIYDDYIVYTSMYNNFIAGTNPPKYTLFSPRTAITRAMFVAILYRMAGNPYDDANPYKSNPFSDINTNAYYYNAACWALDNGITNQITFKPNNAVTREQTARFLFAYAESKGLLGNEAYKNVNLGKYPDYSSVHNWAVEPLQWANYNNMITGTQQGYINPQGATQRIHATRILYGFGKVCNIGNFE